MDGCSERASELSQTILGGSNFDFLPTSISFSLSFSLVLTDWPDMNLLAESTRRNRSTVALKLVIFASFGLGLRDLIW